MMILLKNTRMRTFDMAQCVYVCWRVCIIKTATICHYLRNFEFANVVLEPISRYQKEKNWQILTMWWDWNFSKNAKIKKVSIVNDMLHCKTI